MLKVEKIETPEEFESLREEWRDLLESSAVNCLFLTWEWLYTWWKHLAEDRRLHIVTVRSRGRLIALAPLALRGPRFRRLVPFRALEFIGSGSVGSDYLDVLIRWGEEDAAIPALSASLALAAYPFTLELSRVSSTSRTMNTLAAVLQQEHGWTASQTPSAEYCPFIRLKGHTWDSYLASLGAAHRQNLRRRLRQLDRDFDLHFQRVRSEEERREVMQILFALHTQRWSERGGSNALHSAALRAFHEAFSSMALERGWLRLYVLRLDGVAAAAVYGFKYDDVSSFYQSGFNPDFSQYSVGLVALGLAIKDAIEEGAWEYDLLHGQEQYKYLWAQEHRKLLRRELYPPQAQGVACQRTMDLRRALRDLLRQYTRQPAGARRPFAGSMRGERERRSRGHVASSD
jgi:CelD/BcsL family acetyltransferase involved in cellulose biosynthesis